MDQSNALQPVPEETNNRVELTSSDLSKIEEYKSKIDLSTVSNIIQYGAGAQNRIVGFSEEVLRQVRTRDMGSIGDTLSNLVADVKSFDGTINKKGLLDFLFNSLKKRLNRILAAYSRIETNIFAIELQLEKHNQTLLKDIHLYDKLYEQNQGYYKDLSLYIYAGEEKLEELKNTTLPEMKLKAEEAADQQLWQQYSDFEQQVSRLDKKIHDLKISRTLSLQLAPQIRLVQNNSSLLMEKIHSSITNTLPLWKNQMVLSLGLVHSQQALQAQQAVSNATNEMIRKNSQLLRQSSTQIAVENERSIVDIETIQQANSDLFATIDEVLQIQATGREKRIQIEVELHKIEEELRNKITSVASEGK